MESELTTYWNRVLEVVKPKVSHANFYALFSQSALINLQDDIATIATPATVISDMLYKRFYADIKSVLDQQTKKSIELLFIVKGAKGEITSTKQHATSEGLFAQGHEQTSPTPLPPPPAPFVGHLPRVRSEYTFSTLAVSDSNRLAFESSRTIAKNVGKAYNPFFIYGPVGVGKTHLMHAIANEVYIQQPDKKIIYITSEEFTNEVVEAIKNNDTAKMKRRFRSAYLLLIDDIQFIEGKEKIQEELFHTFNILIDQGSQIALSSDRPPQEIKKLERRLSSRFAGGLSVDIQLPDFELKTAILLKKADKYGKDLPIEVAKLLAENAQDNRSLEGLLLRVMTLATSSGQEMSIEIARHAIGADEDEKRGSLHTDDVVKEVCHFYNIKPTQLKGPRREASLVKARQITMYLLYKELKLTFVEVGNILGGRDHTTVMHGVDKISIQLGENVHISEDIAGIKRLLSV